MAGDKKGWINRACDLEAAGDQAGARALYVANTTVAERRKMHLAAAKSRRWLASPGIAQALADTSKITASLRAARAYPADNKVRRAWEAVGTMLPRDAVDLYGYLPKPARRGRPKGSGAVIGNDDLQSQMQALMSGANPMKRTTAARCALRMAGIRADHLKGRADHLARVYRAKKGS